MAPSERVLLGLTGIASAVWLVQGLQSGIMMGEFLDFDWNERPLRFAMAALGNVFSVLFCAIFAAGYNFDDVRRFGIWLVVIRS